MSKLAKSGDTNLLTFFWPIFGASNSNCYYRPVQEFPAWTSLGLDYTRRRINLYRMFYADFSVNSQPIFMKFCMDHLRVTWRLP